MDVEQMRRFFTSGGATVQDVDDFLSRDYGGAGRSTGLSWPMWLAAVRAAGWAPPAEELPAARKEHARGVAPERYAADRAAVELWTEGGASQARVGMARRDYAKKAAARAAAVPIAREPTFYIDRVDLDRNGYARGGYYAGKYFGAGPPVYVYQGKDSILGTVRGFVRAADREGAKRHVLTEHPLATFGR